MRFTNALVLLLLVITGCRGDVLTLRYHLDEVDASKVARVQTTLLPPMPDRFGKKDKEDGARAEGEGEAERKMLETTLKAFWSFSFMYPTARPMSSIWRGAYARIEGRERQARRHFVKSLDLATRLDMSAVFVAAATLYLAGKRGGNAGAVWMPMGERARAGLDEQRVGVEALVVLRVGHGARDHLVHGFARGLRRELQHRERLAGGHAAHEVDHAARPQLLAIQPVGEAQAQEQPKPTG